MDSFIDRFAQRRNAQDLIKANSMAEAEERERMASRLAGYEEMLQNMQRCNLQNLENAEKVKELLAESLKKIEEVRKEDTSEKERSLEGLMKLLEELKAGQQEFIMAQGAQAKEQREKLEEFLAEQKNLQKEQKIHLQELLDTEKAQVQELLDTEKAQVQELLDAEKAQLQELLDGQKAQLQELLDAQKKELDEMNQSSQDFTHKEAVKVYRNVQAVIEESGSKQTKGFTDAVEGMKHSAGPMVIGILTLIAVLADIGFAVAQFLGLL